MFIASDFCLIYSFYLFSHVQHVSQNGWCHLIDSFLWSLSNGSLLSYLKVRCIEYSKQMKFDVLKITAVLWIRFKISIFTSTKSRFCTPRSLRGWKLLISPIADTHVAQHKGTQPLSRHIKLIFPSRQPRSHCNLDNASIHKSSLLCLFDSK